MPREKKPPGKPTPGAIAKKQANAPPDLDADYFAAQWNASDTLKSLAECLGVSASTCAAVAGRLREAGYALKRFRKGRPRVLEL